MDVKKELTELKKYVTDTIKVYEKIVKEFKKMQWEFDRDTDYIMMECMLNHQLFSTRMYLKMVNISIEENKRNEAALKILETRKKK